MTRPDRERGEADHLWPEILPGGHAVLFTITSLTGEVDAAQVAVRDLRTGTQKILVHGGSDAHYVPSGHLVYIATGALRAIPFDVDRLETRGTAVTMLPLVSTMGVGGAALAGNFAIANDGTLVYVDLPGGVTTNARTLVWVDRTGKEEAIDAPPRAYLQPRLSPDGKRVAVWSSDQTNDIWIWDLERKILTPLTRDPGEDQHPLWTRDGKRIIFSSNRSGVFNLWRQAADGTGEPEQLTKSSEPGFATGITPDGTAVVFFENKSATGRDLNLLQLALDETHRVTSLVGTRAHETEGVVSPNGLWLAYRINSDGLQGNLRSAFSGRQRPRVSCLDGGRHATPLGAQRQGTLLCRRRRIVAAGVRGSEGRDLEQSRADQTLRAALLCPPQLWALVRRVARRPTVPDDQRARNRRFARAYPPATLGHGA